MQRWKDTADRYMLEALTERKNLIALQEHMDKNYVHKDNVAPPQDGQGAELLGPPRGGSSSDLADSDSLSVAVTWPAIPKYLLEPIVFRDANLGIAMVAGYHGEQWIFKVNSGNWMTVRKVDVRDPTFIMGALNLPPTPSLPEAVAGNASAPVGVQKENNAPKS